MALFGMTPPEIMQATQTAWSFWVDQKVYEFQSAGQRQKQLTDRQKTVEEHIKSKLREVEATCNAMKAERQLNKKIDEAEQEKRKVSEELERLRCEVAAAEDRHSRLQRQVLGEQRHELFRRPLLEAPSPAPALAPDAVAGRRMSKMMGDSVPRHIPFQEPRTILESATCASHGNHFQANSLEHPPDASCPRSPQAFSELGDQRGGEFSNLGVPHSSGSMHVSLQDVVRHRNLAEHETAVAPAAMMLLAKIVVALVVSC